MVRTRPSETERRNRTERASVVEEEKEGERVRSVRR